MRDKCLDTIYKLFKSVAESEAEVVNNVMYLIPDVFMERIDEGITIFNKLIERNDIKQQLYSFIGTHLLRQIETIAKLKPEFVDTIYKNYFGYICSNESGIIIEEPNEKYKQLFNGYSISRVTTDYLEVRKLEGIKVLIGCINFDNYKKYIKSSDPELKDETIQQALNRVTSFPFKFKGHCVCFYEDMSDIWDNVHSDYANLFDYLFEYIAKYVERYGDGEIFELFKSQKMVGQLWLRFIDFMLKNKEKYADELTDLAVYQTSLKFSLTLYKKAANILECMIPTLEDEQKNYIEQKLYDLFQGKRKILDFPHEAAQLRARRYIDMLGEHLSLPETKAVYEKDRSEGKEPHKIFTEPSVKVDFEPSSVDYDTFRYGNLKDVEQIEFAKMLKTLRQFYYDNLNNKPETTSIKHILLHIRACEEIYNKQKENLTKKLKNDYLTNLSLALTKVCTNLQSATKEDKTFIKELLLKLLEVNTMPIEDSSNVDTIFYLSNSGPKHQAAQAIALFLLDNEDLELYKELTSLVSIHGDSSMLFNILSGLFPKGEAFRNTEENWQLLTLLTENVVEHYKDYNELKTALYYYVLYAAIFEPDKSREIIERLETCGASDIYFMNSIYNVLYYYFDPHYTRLDWIRERQERLINTYNSAIYEKILQLLGTDMVSHKDIIKTVISNILQKENFLSSLEQNKKCLNLFLNQLTYNENNYKIINDFLPLLSMLVKTVLQLKGGEDSKRIINQVVGLIEVVEIQDSSDFPYLFELLIDFLDQSDARADNYDLYLRLDKIIDFLQKISNKEKFFIIKDNEKLLEQYGYIINKITLFSWSTKCMNFIWNLDC